MVNSQEFSGYLRKPYNLEQAQADELKAITATWPYFSNAHVLLSRALHNTNNPEFDQQLKQASMHAGNRKLLYSLVNIDTEGKDDHSLPFDLVNAAPPARPESPVEAALVVEKIAIPEIDIAPDTEEISAEESNIAVKEAEEATKAEPQYDHHAPDIAFDDLYATAAEEPETEEITATEATLSPEEKLEDIIIDKVAEREENKDETPLSSEENFEDTMLESIAGLQSEDAHTEGNEKKDEFEESIPKVLAEIAATEKDDTTTEEKNVADEKFAYPKKNVDEDHEYLHGYDDEDWDDEGQPYFGTVTKAPEPQEDAVTEEEKTSHGTEHTETPAEEIYAAHAGIEQGIEEETEDGPVELPEPDTFYNWLRVLEHLPADPDAPKAESYENTTDGTAEPASEHAEEHTAPVHEIAFKMEKKTPVSNEKPDTDNIIDRFINANPVISRPKAEFFNPIDKARESDTPRDDIATETLARIYLGQNLYDRAANIYEKLATLHPDKGSYYQQKAEEIKNTKKT